MAKILLGCLVGCMPAQGIEAVTALLDFIYLAQYSAHDFETLGYLKEALDRFHKNQEYFIKTRVREDFQYPKISFPPPLCRSYRTIWDYRQLQHRNVREAPH